MRRSNIEFIGRETAAGREWLLGAVDTMEAQFGQRFSYGHHGVGIQDADDIGIWFTLDGLE